MIVFCYVSDDRKVLRKIATELRKRKRGCPGENVELIEIVQSNKKAKLSNNDASESMLAKINLSTDFVEWDGILVSKEGSYLLIRN